MDGVLLLNKPRSMTSHDCVMRIRKLLKTKKVGHTGTLDPEVDGVLPICIGGATKLVQFLTAEKKTYVGEVTIGYSTTTEDASGEVIDRKNVTETITELQIDALLQTMIGTNDQTPPMYSAVKINGKKLYEYARAGEDIARPTRQVTIYDIKRSSSIVHADGLIKFSFTVTGSKGIFIRTVAVTIGEKLGYPAHMSNLTRTASGDFTLDQCVTFDDIEKSNYQLLTINEALRDFPRGRVNEWEEKLVRNGVKLRNGQVIPPMKEGPFLVSNQKGEALAIYEWHPDENEYASVRGL